jgi:hypothetical protein
LLESFDLVFLGHHKHHSVGLQGYIPPLSGVFGIRVAVDEAEQRNHRIWVILVKLDFLGS